MRECRGRRMWLERPTYSPLSLPQLFFSAPFAFFAVSHSCFVSNTYPLPLQLFCPWQELVAVAHADLPLQELPPWHFTFASSACAVVTATLPNSRAAAVASAMPVVFRLAIESLLCVHVDRSEL